MLKAIIISWLLMIVYVSVRFEYKYAVATIVALVHDLSDHRGGLFHHRPGSDDRDRGGGADHPGLFTL